MLFPRNGSPTKGAIHLKHVTDTGDLVRDRRYSHGPHRRKHGLLGNAHRRIFNTRWPILKTVVAQLKAESSEIQKARKWITSRQRIADEVLQRHITELANGG